jgi:hypothetical protein
MSGIDRTSGHIGMSNSGSTLKAVGGAAFSAVQTGGSIAANVMGGPMAGYAVSAGMSALRSGVSGGTGGDVGGALGDVSNQASANASATNDQTGSLIQQSQSQQAELFALQQAMNSQSQAFNTLTNVQKSKHDAAMAAIQNTR